MKLNKSSPPLPSCCFFWSINEARSPLFFFFLLLEAFAPVLGLSIRLRSRRQFSLLIWKHTKHFVLRDLVLPCLVFVYLILVEDVMPGIKKMPQASQLDLSLGFRRPALLRTVSESRA